MAAFAMKRISFNADEDLLDRARHVARSRGMSLNAAFRLWLEEYTAGNGNALAYDDLMRRLSQVHAGGKFSRDECNPR